MKATFEFNLPDEADDYKLVMKAVPMQSALYEIFNTARNCLKHDGNEHDALETIKLLASEFLDE